MVYNKTAHDYALEYAEKYGFYVFPLASGTKIPLKGFSWKQSSTNDTATIREMIKKYPDCNWALDCGKSKLISVDEDNKNGKKGTEELNFVKALNGDLPATLKIATPNNGYHTILKGLTSSSKDKVADGVDIKSEGGYVVMPGSRISEGNGHYRIITNGQISNAPEWLTTLAGAPNKENKEKDKITTNIQFDLNQVENITKSIDYLQSLKDDGRGTFATACMLKDFGVDHEVALSLMMKYWVAAGTGHRTYRHVKKRVENVYRYAQEQVGSKSNTETFKPLTERPMEEKYFMGIPKPRDWIIQDWLPANEITSIYGDGGIGKSLLSMQLGFSVAYGVPFFDIPIAKTMPVLMVMCEDSNDELHRRIYSIRKSQKYDFKANREASFKFWSRVGLNNILAETDRFSLEARPFLADLKKEITNMGDGQKLVVLDTLTDVFAGNENDRTTVNQFIKTYIGGLAKDCNATIIMIGHPSKSGKSDKSGFSGSTAWNNSVRNRWYLTNNEINDSYRVLQRIKSNYAASGEEINLFWEKGVFNKVEESNICDEDEQANKDIIYNLVLEQSEKGKPYGWHFNSTEFIGHMKITNINGKLMDSKEIKRLVNLLANENKLEIIQQSPYKNGVWIKGMSKDIRVPMARLMAR